MNFENPKTQNQKIKILFSLFQSEIKKLKNKNSFIKK